MKAFFIDFVLCFFPGGFAWFIYFIFFAPLSSLIWCSGYRAALRCPQSDTMSLTTSLHLKQPASSKLVCALFFFFFSFFFLFSFFFFFSRWWFWFMHCSCFFLFFRSFQFFFLVTDNSAAAAGAQAESPGLFRRRAFTRSNSGWTPFFILFYFILCIYLCIDFVYRLVAQASASAKRATGICRPAQTARWTRKRSDGGTAAATTTDDSACFFIFAFCFMHIYSPRMAIFLLVCLLRVHIYSMRTHV